MSETAVQAPSTAPDIEAEVDLAIMICDGDVRAALKATLIANAFLEEEAERIKEMVSAGYTRQGAQSTVVAARGWEAVRASTALKAEPRARMPVFKARLSELN